MKNEIKSTVAYTVAGIVVGVASWYVRINLLALVIAVAVLFGMYLLLQNLLGLKAKMKWFMSNGGWIYIFVWFITWTILVNL